VSTPHVKIAQNSGIERIVPFNGTKGGPNILCIVVRRHLLCVWCDNRMIHYDCLTVNNKSGAVLTFIIFSTWRRNIRAYSSDSLFESRTSVPCLRHNIVNRLALAQSTWDVTTSTHDDVIKTAVRRQPTQKNQQTLSFMNNSSSSFCHHQETIQHDDDVFGVQPTCSVSTMSSGPNVAVGAEVSPPIGSAGCRSNRRQ
jgi:hypothetical protein